jgi:hypothetical protein
MVLAIIILAAALLLAAAIGLSIVSWPRLGLDRRGAVQDATMLAEARIDYLTRQSVQQMRDAVRSHLREQRDITE